MKKRYLVLIICSTVIIAVLAVVYPMAQRAYSPNKKPAEQSQPNKNNPLGTTKAKSDSTPEPTQKDTPTPPTCGPFTLQLGRQFLGGGAVADTNSSVVNTETPDMRISTCVYTANQKSVRLVSYLAKTDLGRSANAVSFGSNRPSGTQVVQGYGQSAFWNNTTNILSVLKNNNRYDISVRGDLHDTEPAAVIIVPKL